MYNLNIINENNKLNKIEDVECASNFYKRLIGLMFKEKFSGLIFKQENPHKIYSSIHSYFMKVPIDIIYINTDRNIQEIVTLKPWHLHIPQKNNTKYIIELPENSIKKYSITINSKIVIENGKK